MIYIIIIFYNLKVENFYRERRITFTTIHNIPYSIYKLVITSNKQLTIESWSIVIVVLMNKFSLFQLSSLPSVKSTVIVVFIGFGTSGLSLRVSSADISNAEQMDINFPNVILLPLSKRISFWN